MAENMHEKENLKLLEPFNTFTDSMFIISFGDDFLYSTAEIFLL